MTAPDPAQLGALAGPAPDGAAATIAAGPAGPGAGGTSAGDGAAAAAPGSAAGTIDAGVPAVPGTTAGALSPAPELPLADGSAGSAAGAARRRRGPARRDDRRRRPAARRLRDRADPRGDLGRPAHERPGRRLLVRARPARRVRAHQRRPRRRHLRRRRDADLRTGRAARRRVRLDHRRRRRLRPQRLRRGHRRAHHHLRRRAGPLRLRRPLPRRRAADPLPRPAARARGDALELRPAHGRRALRAAALLGVHGARGRLAGARARRRRPRTWSRSARPRPSSSIDLDGDVEEYDLDEYDRVIIRGGAADDSLIVEASAVAYAGILVFEGGEGEDTAELRLPDAGGAYDLATAEPVKPRFEITIGGDRQLVSAGLEELTITGGTGADELTFTAGAAEYGGRFSFAGGDGDDTLLGPDKLTFWQIDAANGGRFSTGPFDDFFFTDVESVTGGNKLDGFAFSAGGHLDGTVGGGAGEVELDLGFVYLKGSLTITRQVADITLSDGTTVLDDAVFYKVGIESAEVFIGSGRGTDGAIGLSGTIGPDGGLALTIVSSGTDTYVAVRAADLEVALTGVAGVTLTTGALAVDFNSTDANGLFLDFSTFDVDDDPGTADAFTVPGAGSVTEIDFDTAVRRGTAVGATVDLFGLVGGTVDVSFEQRSVDLLDLDGSAATTEAPLEGASMLVFALDITELHLGSGDFLISVTDGTIGLVSISAPAVSAEDALDGVTDGRRWTAVTSRDLAVTLTLPGFSVIGRRRLVHDQHRLGPVPAGAGDPRRAPSRRRCRSPSSPSRSTGPTPPATAASRSTPTATAPPTSSTPASCSPSRTWRSRTTSSRSRSPATSRATSSSSCTSPRASPTASPPSRSTWTRTTPTTPPTRRAPS